MDSTRRESRAYIRELEILMARRLPIAMWIGGGLLAELFVLELSMASSRLPYLLLWLGVSTAPVLTVLSCRRLLLRRRSLSWATASAVASTLTLFVGYAAVVKPDAPVVGAQLAIALLIASVVFPWSAACQVVASVAPIGSFALLLWAEANTANSLYLFIVVSTAAAAAALIARHLDVQRWAIFRETRARGEAMLVTSSLLNVARELSAAGDPRNVLDRIVHRTRDLLHADWCVLLLRAHQSGTFRIAAGSALRPDLLQEGQGVEFRTEDYPTTHALTEGIGVLEVSRRNPPDARWRALMAYFRTRSMLVAPMEQSGTVIGLLAVGRGRTEDPFPLRHHRILQGIARQATVALQNARLIADLEQANRLKWEFVATMSHELRTPLNIVIGYTDLLVEGAFGVLPKSALDPLEKVREQSRELLQLIDATLDVNRLEAGRIELHVSEIELEDFLQELAQQLERLPRTPEVEFAVLARSTGRIRTDLGKLTIVIRNLVSNAFKFTQRGRVTLEAEAKEDGGAQFVVRDTGVGIPDADKERIFEMFYQVSRPGQVSRGVGLGLYIVQQFTKLLGGKVEVQSRELVGTTFRVDIPALPRLRATTPTMLPEWLADGGL
ncbi:MAG: hypothetical protein KatS3mg077_0301 [Candidatus Binatia bacterium]|nr:MAG: hypothetical protein KatS3mg077_0301 [Candidatus Binatia bacterium]